jgi:hypothetical protein
MFFVLSLGPTLKIFGTETGIPMPYSVLMKVPPFDSGRTPVRFVVVGMFFLMIVAAVGLSHRTLPDYSLGSALGPVGDVVFVRLDDHGSLFANLSTPGVRPAGRLEQNSFRPSA